MFNVKTIQTCVLMYLCNMLVFLYTIGCTISGIFSGNLEHELEDMHQYKPNPYQVRHTLIIIKENTNNYIVLLIKS